MVILSIREPQNWFSGLENVTSASVGQMGVISISAALSLRTKLDEKDCKPNWGQARP